MVKTPADDAKASSAAEVAGEERMRNFRQPSPTVTPKIARKPMMQHAAMTIYNCYVDRVPMFIVLSNIMNVNYRRTINE